ncbi:unnamed protein product, partial [marine sediment metagenome]
MEQTNYTIVAIAAVACLFIGGFVGMQMAPEGETITDTIEVPVNPLEGKTVTLGFIAAQTSDLEYKVPVIEEMVMADINEYASKMSYDVEFEWLIDCADAQATVHLEKVQGFKAIDVNIFMGGAWTSQAAAAISYCNENDMLMISPSSTNPLLSIPNDALIRMCPTDRTQTPANRQMLETWGIDAVVFLHRADGWGDGIYNLLEVELADAGIVILER